MSCALIDCIESNDTLYFNPKSQEKNAIEGKAVLIDCEVAESPNSGNDFTLYFNQNNSIH